MSEIETVFGLLMYGGLTLVSCQMCTQLLSHSLSSAEQEQKMVEKLEG